jgi:hypothetical protein
MHKKYSANSKIIAKEFSNFNKNFSQLERLLQKNHSNQIYLDTYGLETESTQALDTPKKKEKDFLSHFKSNVNNEKTCNYNASSINNLNDFKQSNDFDEEVKLKKTNELKKMINKIELSQNLKKKNYLNSQEDKNNKLQDCDLYQYNNLRYNLYTENYDNSNILSKGNVNESKAYNINKKIEKSLKFDLDGSLTVINEKDSSCEKIFEPGERFLRKISDEKRNKNNNFCNQKTKNELRIENKLLKEERILFRTKLEKCK